MQTLTVGQMAKRYSLSRSTLLYYDSIGLLSPSARSAANYRLYSDADVERMDLIDIYRQAGLPLKVIACVLDSDRGALRDLLAARLRDMNGEVSALRRQQQTIVKLLQSEVASSSVPTMDKEAWVAILRSTGLSDADMRRWHQEFERLAPDAHQDFLESLAIADEEITDIRRRSRSEANEWPESDTPG